MYPNSPILLKCYFVQRSLESSSLSQNRPACMYRTAHQFAFVNHPENTPSPAHSPIPHSHPHPKDMTWACVYMCIIKYRFTHKYYVHVYTYMINMYMYVYIYVYVYVYIYIYICIHACTHTHVHMCIYEYVCTLTEFWLMCRAWCFFFKNFLTDGGTLALILANLSIALARRAFCASSSFSSCASWRTSFWACALAPAPLQSCSRQSVLSACCFVFFSCEVGDENWPHRDARAQTHAQTYAYTHVHAHMHAHPQTRTCTQTQTQTRAHRHAHASAYTRSRARTQTNSRTHAHTDT